VDGVDGLRVRSVGLDGSEKDGVGTEGADVVETLGHAVEAAACCRIVRGGAEVHGGYVVDDGVVPPGIGAHAGADPAGTGQGLGCSACEVQTTEGKTECEESAASRLGHCACYSRCYARSGVSGNAAYMP